MKKLILCLICSLIAVASIIRADGTPDEAKKRAPSVDQIAANALVDAAKKCYNRNDLASAYKLLNQSLNKAPNNPEAVLYLAKTLEKLEKNRAASKQYRLYLELTRSEGKTSNRYLAERRARALDAVYDAFNDLKEKQAKEWKQFLAQYGSRLEDELKVEIDGIMTVLSDEAEAKEDDAADIGRSVVLKGRELHRFLARARLYTWNGKDGWTRDVTAALRIRGGDGFVDIAHVDETRHIALLAFPIRYRHGMKVRWKFEKRGDIRIAVLRENGGDDPHYAGVRGDGTHEVSLTCFAKYCVWQVDDGKPFTPELVPDYRPERLGAMIGQEAVLRLYEVEVRVPVR